MDPEIPDVEDSGDLSESDEPIPPPEEELEKLKEPLNVEMIIPSELNANPLISSLLTDFQKLVS